MRIIGGYLLDDKMDEAVTQYINSHQANEHPNHMNSNVLTLNVQDDGTGRLTVMHSQCFTSPLCRQVSVGEQVGDGPWAGEELLDPDCRIAALVAQLAQNSRASQHQSIHHKMTSLRSDVDPSVILDGSMRLLSGQTILQDQHEQIVVQAPPLAPLPPLQEMKPCPNTDWFSKSRTMPSIKDDSPICEESQSPDLEIEDSLSPAPSKQQSKKSLPHKKRISKKLKKNGGNTSQQGIVVINCTDDVNHEEILPDNFVNGVQHQEQLSEDAQDHITHQMRPILLCNLCGEFYGEEQLKFYQHLKEHYEPHDTIIIENPVPDLQIDKMTNTCIVDNGATLPDSIVELSLENTIPKTMYQNIDKHIMYTPNDKTMNYSNRGIQYSMEKEPTPTSEVEKSILYDSLNKLELYSCVKCNKTFRKQKLCEAHIKEVHSNAKIEDMSEFSEPEDLMEGIHVSVEEGGEQYEHSLMPHLTVENGHVHQDHVRQWYLRNSASGVQVCVSDGGYCPVCPAPLVSASAPVPTSASVSVSTSAPVHSSAPTTTLASTPMPRDPLHDSQPLKEEVLHRILDTEVPTEPIITENMMNECEAPPVPQPPADAAKEEKKQKKVYECQQCKRVFPHRSSLLYHELSHAAKQHSCKDCEKSFYTSNALKVHKRVHNGDRPYKCDVCGRDFRQWSDLKYHKAIHTAQKRFKCDFCGKEFARKYSLNVHRRIHTGERNYKCDYCNKRFSASSYRLTHMRTHTGDRPHKCEQCDKCFRVAFDLRRHILTHEKAKIRSEQQKLKIKMENAPEAGAVEETETDSSEIKKTAAAKSSTVTKSDKKAKPTKRNGKKGTPNMTVSQNDGQFKMDPVYCNNIEVFDTRQEGYEKFKEAYSETVDYNKDIELKIIYKDSSNERDFATLKPTYKSILENSDKTVFSRMENTDGKLQIFTQVEKNEEYASPIIQNTQAIVDGRNLEREVIREIKSDVNVGVTETVFLERLNSFYNIPAV